MGERLEKGCVMFKITRLRIPELLVFALGLSLVVACGGDSPEEGDGTPTSVLGQELVGISQLADKLVTENAQAFEGLQFAAAALQSAFAPAVFAEVAQKQESCIPADLQNTTLEYDPPSGTYTSSEIPGAPAGGVSILLYEIDQGTPTTTQIGRLNVTCSGLLSNPNLLATLRTADDVDVLEINAMVSSLSLDSYSMTVSGFLADSTGEGKVRFGDFGSSGGSMSSFQSLFGVDFTIGEDTRAVLTRNQYVDGSEQSVFLNVFREMPPDFLRVFDFTANLTGTGPVMQGPAFFEYWADPVNLTGYSYSTVACFEGAFDDMNVMVASECFPTPDIEDLALVTLPPSELQAIEDAYQGLQGMYAAVEGISTAAAAIGQAALAEMSL